MNFWEMILVSIGLSMDAFTVAICKGIHIQRSTRLAIQLACSFGIFQAIMPLLGYSLGTILEGIISTFGRFLSCGVLICIGINMIKNTKKSDKENLSILKWYTLLFLSIATSIDAFAVGIALTFLSTHIYKDIFIIGLITFILSFLGVKIGKCVGSRLQTKAPLLGGIIIVLLGIKNLFSFSI